MTEVGRLFQMAGTAELKARPRYAVLARGVWSRGRVDERNGQVVAWLSGSALVSINEVTLRWARLVLG